MQCHSSDNKKTKTHQGLWDNGPEEVIKRSMIMHVDAVSEDLNESEENFIEN